MENCMYNNISIDKNKLLSMGFKEDEIKHVMYLYQNRAKFNTAFLQQYGYNHDQIKKLMYINSVCIGKIQIDSKEDMIRHLRKLYGTDYKISVQDLSVSNVTSVPRVAVIDDIIDEPYNIWNSRNYKGKEKLYNVIEASGQRIMVETSKKPVLKYGQTKVIPGVLEIKGIRKNGNVVISLDRRYCKLCNRFVIVASLRNPEFHHGKYEIICFEGTKVYVYASNMGIKESVKYSGGTQRVYDYGIFEFEIKNKLDVVAKNMYVHLHGVAVSFHTETSKYKTLTLNEEEVDSSSNVIV